MNLYKPEDFKNFKTPWLVGLWLCCGTTLISRWFGILTLTIWGNSSGAVSAHCFAQTFWLLTSFVFPHIRDHWLCAAAYIKDLRTVHYARCRLHTWSPLSIVSMSAAIDKCRMIWLLPGWRFFASLADFPPALWRTSTRRPYISYFLCALLPKKLMKRTHGALCKHTWSLVNDTPIVTCVYFVFQFQCWQMQPDIWHSDGWQGWHICAPLCTLCSHTFTLAGWTVTRQVVSFSV